MRKKNKPPRLPKRKNILSEELVVSYVPVEKYKCVLKRRGDKKVVLGNKEVFYELRISRRARKARLTAYRDANLVVTIPVDFPETSAEKLIFAKSRWVLAKLKYFERFRDKPYLRRGSRAEYLKLKADALRLAKEKVRHFNQFYNFKISRISVKNQKTRWGSCSRGGNLNFNYKIVLLPERLCDYIVVHELCHLAEFNHSGNFWEMVAKTVPDHKKIIKEIWS